MNVKENPQLGLLMMEIKNEVSSVIKTEKRIKLFLDVPINSGDNFAIVESTNGTPVGSVSKDENGIWVGSVDLDLLAEVIEVESKS